jgi:hypothetical protein
VFWTVTARLSQSTADRGSAASRKQAIAVSRRGGRKTPVSNLLDILNSSQSGDSKMKADAGSADGLRDAVIRAVEASDATHGMTIETIDGQAHEAFEPVIVGRDYISFRGSKQPTYRMSTVPFSAIANIMS